MRVAFAVLVCVLQFTRVFATLGVDLSQAACNSGSYDFGCLVSSGYTFAIIEAWDGGYGYTSNIGMHACCDVNVVLSLVFRLSCCLVDLVC